eukprot:CAMPEP_0115316108 /NCGR_PEP_ID=MMETSP0270-20121206/77944_1 /TAXON_ID=71861 /ORGANISM="Scrippsiella trochoidea, Strain CCMP3099" /LENGTH=125 /DNA_ID=CAMNT_0002735487 /DNA_START=231 /DNA_END=605 /DNA_ORIENTATION=+
MVPKATDPRLVGQAAVDPLPPLCEFPEREAIGVGGVASLRYTAPIEVIADVEQVLGISQAGTLLHNMCDKDLRTIVDALDVLAIVWALLPMTAHVRRCFVPREHGPPVADSEHVRHPGTVLLNFK